MAEIENTRHIFLDFLCASLHGKNKGTGPVGEVLHGAASDMTLPIDAMPEKTDSVGAEPQRTVPVGANPERTVPVGSDSERTVPVGSDSERTVPVGSCNWQELFSLASRHHVLPLVADVACRCPECADIPPSLLAEVQSQTLQVYVQQAVKYINH